MPESPSTAGVIAWLPLAVPLLYLAASLLPVPDRSRDRRGPTATTALAVMALAGAAGLAALCAVAGSAVYRLGPGLPVGPTGELALSLRLDLVSVAMLLLVSFVGAIITAYSARYLDGEPGRGRFLSRLMLTLAAVSVLVLSNNLLLLALAWVATSLSFHQLLVFYADRPRAVAAAHKKFLVSRLGDLSLLGAVGLVGASLGTYELDLVLARLPEASQWPGTLSAAALLFAASAILKCALLPFHGWLIQVMEAPTPVSALLHAGIVNIGGFLLIRVSPLMIEAPAAQFLLVAAGGVTAVVAALVMTRQTSVKVTLAWSTCAQMGFMLLQCGLGAYAIALLHLLAHSLYKAHAFLSAGGAVERYRVARLLDAPPPGSAAAWVAAPLLAAAALVPPALAFGFSPASQPALWALAAVLVLGATPPLIQAAAGGLPRPLALCGVVTLGGLYLAWHGIAQWLAPGVVATGRPDLGALALVGLLFGALYAAQAVGALRPGGALTGRLEPHLQAGLYLDELFTRAAFRLWPPRAPDRPPAPEDAPVHASPREEHL